MNREETRAYLQGWQDAMEDITWEAENYLPGTVISNKLHDMVDSKRAQITDQITEKMDVIREKMQKKIMRGLFDILLENLGQSRQRQS